MYKEISRRSENKKTKISSTFGFSYANMNKVIHFLSRDEQNGDINVLFGSPIQFHTLDPQVSMGDIY